MKVPAAFALFALAATLTACSDSPQSQQKVREDTARTTATIKSDVKAAALGIRDGLRQSTPSANTAGLLNLNTANREQLQALPGVSHSTADRIIAHRPYRDPEELKRKGIVSASEYDRISAQVTATR